MKKIFFVLVIIAIAYQSKAQQLFSVKPADSLTSKLWSPSFNVKPSDSSFYQKYFNVSPLKPGTQLSVTKPDNAEFFYSTMPVVKVSSGDKMPVVKPGSSNEKYTMLVKKIKVVNPLIKEQPVTP